MSAASRSVRASAASERRDHRPGRGSFRLSEHLAHGGVAVDHRHAEPPRRGDESAVARQLQHHDPLAAAEEFFHDAEADVAQPADDDVPALGDAAHLQGAAEARAQQVVGHDGRERGGQRGAQQPQHRHQQLEPR
jgi:hypothetical protein